MRKKESSNKIPPQFSNEVIQQFHKVVLLLTRPVRSHPDVKAFQALIGDTKDFTPLNYGSHWAEKRATEKEYWVQVLGGDGDAMTHDEVCAKFKMKPRTLAVKMSTGRGRFHVRRIDEIYEITKKSYYSRP